MTQTDQNVKILLAEDDTDMRRFLVKALQNAGFDVISYDNGMSAYQRLREEPFQLLLTDIVMPEMDGIELARRAAELDPDIKIMFITGFAAVALNADSNAPKQAKVLSKPIHLRDLLAIKPLGEPIPLEQVESITSIRKRFVTPGMSLGALSPEAHKTLNVAMNRIGAHSENTGMIGDRMDTDVVAGIEAGLETILVLTGSTTIEDVERYPFRPSRVLPSIAASRPSRSWVSAGPPSGPGTSGTWAASIRRLDSAFRPIALMALAGGPMKTSPASAQACAKPAFSERKP